MSTYRAVHVAPDGTLQPIERELKQPDYDHVRIRVEACGICHSDSAGVHPHSETELGPVPGHEVVGVIDAVGEGVSNWAPGNRVGVGFLAGHCGGCDECRRGRFVNCSNQRWTGIHVDGGYAEVAYVRQSGLVAIPDSLSPQEAAPLLCAGFTMYNALLKSAASPGDLVVIQGIGGLGHLGIQYAAKMGLEVVAVARGTEKEELSRSLGAHHYLDSAAVDAAAEVKTLGGARAIIATAAGGSMSSLLDGLAYGGRFVAVGVTDRPIEVSTANLIFGGVQVHGSLTGTPAENERNMRFAAAQGIRAVTEVVPLSDAPAAYDRMMSGDARFRMVLTI
jgi:alcohol dehydrogenase, propanol-preferring